VFRNFPLNTLHEHAGVAAQAAEAAAGQGKFWEMHDILYQHQDDLANTALEEYALKVGVEIYQFNADLAGEKYARKVRDDFRGGVRSGVNGTPTFFVNGARYDGEHTFDAMLAALENAAQAK
jgi:protein-disulfide isomerase